MNEFAISSLTPADYEAQVLKRNFQIKDLIENTRPQAVSNIQKHQIQQKISQDKAHNIEESSIPPNTNEMVSTLKLVQKKLAPKYYGPYQVVSQTQREIIFYETEQKNNYQ